MSPAGVNGGYFHQTGALPVQQAHSTTTHEAPPHAVTPSGAAAAPPVPQPAPPVGPVPVPPHALVSTATTTVVK